MKRIIFTPTTDEEKQLSKSFKIFCVEKEKNMKKVFFELVKKLLEEK